MRDQLDSKHPNDVQVLVTLGSSCETDRVLALSVNFEIKPVILWILSVISEHAKPVWRKLREQIAARVSAMARSLACQRARVKYLAGRVGSVRTRALRLARSLLRKGTGSYAKFRI